MPTAVAAEQPHSSVCRFSYLNWMWYGWGALMINQFKGTDAQLVDGGNVLEYYGLDNTSEWAFCGYSALFFVAFILIAWAALTLVRFQKR